MLPFAPTYSLLKVPACSCSISWTSLLVDILTLASACNMEWQMQACWLFWQITLRICDITCILMKTPYRFDTCFVKMLRGFPHCHGHWDWGIRTVFPKNSVSQCFTTTWEACLTKVAYFPYTCHSHFLQFLYSDWGKQTPVYLFKILPMLSDT